MPPRLLVLVWLLPALLSAVPATRPNEEIGVLVKQLSSEHWRERQAAQDRLIEIGPDAEADLQRLRAATQDEDLRTSLDTVLNRIDEGRRTGPSRLTLHVRSAPADQVLEEAARQAGVRLSFPGLDEWRGERSRVSLDADREPFWAVMRRLAPAAGLAPIVNGEMAAIELHPGPWRIQRSAVSGPLLVVAGTVSRTSEIDFGESKAPQRSLSLELEVYVDPNLRVLRYTATPRLTEATDENGASLLDPAAEVEEPTINDGSHPLKWEADVDLKEAARPGQRLRSLKGAVVLVVRSRSESAEVPDLLRATGAQRVVAGRRFVVNQVRAGEDSSVVSLAVHRGGMGRDQWRMLIAGQALRHELRLLDGRGRAFAPAAVALENPRDVSRDQTTLTCTFMRPKSADGKPLVGEPARLVIDVTTEVKTLTVPFELTDIALP